MKFMKKFGINSIVDLLDATILSILGAAFVLYSVFYKGFAEVHITLSFLTFPIFIGEIILFLSLGLTIAKFIITRKSFSGFYILFGLFLLFIFLKAIFGYIKFGPLALRHASMFYYSLFGIIAYEMYQPKLLKVNLLLILFFVLSLLGIATYYNFTYLILMFIFLIKSRSMILRLLGLIILVLFFPFNYLLFCCRTQLVGHIIGFAFILISIILTIRVKPKYKLLFALVSVCVFLAIIINSKDNSRIASLISPGKFISAFKEWDKMLEKRKNNFRPKEIPVMLYHPENKQDIPQVRIVEELEKIKEANEVNVKEDKLEIELRFNPENEAELLQSLKSKGIVLQSLPKPLTLDKALRIETGALDKKVLTSSIVLPKPLTLDKVTPGSGPIETGALDKKVLTSSIVLPKDKKTRNEIIAFLREKRMISPELVANPEIGSGIETRFSTAIYRLFVWRDMLRDMLRYKPIFGFAFGKPLRSESIEITGMAYGEWTRDGWIAAHNSFLEVIYRSGIIGVIFISFIFVMLFIMIKRFLRSKSITGILLVSIIIYWLAVAMVYVTFEMPYSAITFWCLFGITFAYSKEISLINNSKK